MLLVSYSFDTRIQTLPEAITMSRLELLQQADESRDLAEHGRRLTRLFTQPEDRTRSEEYIDELEATALRLETEAATVE